MLSLISIFRNKATSNTITITDNLMKLILIGISCSVLTQRLKIVARQNPIRILRSILIFVTLFHVYAFSLLVRTSIFCTDSTTRVISTFVFSTEFCSDINFVIDDDTDLCIHFFFTRVRNYSPIHTLVNTKTNTNLITNTNTKTKTNTKTN